MSEDAKTSFDWATEIICGHGEEIDEEIERKLTEGDFLGAAQLVAMLAHMEALCLTAEEEAPRCNA